MQATIGIDYTAAVQQGGGIGRYVRSLVHALAAIDSETDYRIFAAGVTDQHELPTLGENFTWKPTSLGDQGLVRLWYRLHVPLPIERWTGRLDLYHAPDFLLPPVRKDTKTLLTIHDLSFIRAPETATESLRQFLNKAVPRSVERADHILADSAATKDDLIELYQTPTEKITVLYSGVDPRFKPTNDPVVLQTIREKYEIGAADFILSLGTVQPRKNYVRLVEAFNALPQKDAKLVIVGGKGWLAEPLFECINDLGLSERVILPGFADDVDLPALYSAAKIFAYPSLYEGFGLPVLEAMACGTPVLASNVSSIPEVTGKDGAVLVDPFDTAGMTEQLNKLLVNEALRNQLVAAGVKEAERFTWARAAEQLHTIYSDLLSGGINGY